MNNQTFSEECSGLRAGVKSAVANVLAVVFGAFLIQIIAKGFASQQILGLSGAWWLALYVGRFVASTWLAVPISVFGVAIIVFATTQAGFYEQLAIKLPSSVSESLMTSALNGLVFSTPIVVNILVDRMFGKWMPIVRSSHERE